MRTKEIPESSRRTPKTEHYCVVCQKDIKPKAKFLWVHVVGGGTHVLHPDDEADFDGKGDMGMFPIGSDCAKKIGLEWASLDQD